MTGVLLRATEPWLSAPAGAAGAFTVWTWTVIPWTGGHILSSVMECEPHPHSFAIRAGRRRALPPRAAHVPLGKVLGVRVGKTGSFAVFVADSFADEERDRIYEDLASEAR